MNSFNQSGYSGASVSFDQVLDGGLLSAVFQPIVSNATMEVVGYEGLIRGPEGSALATPAALFAAAHACGRDTELQMHCLRTVWQRFTTLELPGKLFMNVCAAILLEPKLQHRTLLQMLEGAGIDSGHVVLELTEEQGVTDFRRLRRMAGILRRQGFPLAIDDLGSGFASLRMWLELQPAWVKVDITFISGIERDPFKQAFLRAIRDIASTYGTRVIAEGIETAAELTFIRELGITYGQGFHIARPMAHPAPLWP